MSLPARAVEELDRGRDRLSAGLDARRERYAHVRRELGVAQRELCKLAKERLDAASLARFSGVLEAVWAERESLAADLAEFTARERDLRAEAESLRRAHARLDLLRAKAVAAQSVRSRAQPEDRGGYLPPVARAELDSETNVFDRARADLTLRLTKHDSALQRHAAEVWTRRERLVAVERLRRSLPEVWRPSTTPAGDEFARILAALAGPRRYAEALLSKCDTLAEESASLELAAREAEFLLRASEAGESRRNELDRSLAATSEALEVFLLASERRRRRCGARAALPSGKRRSRTRPETRRLISTD
ncbi:MAG: hypothetical protein ACLPYS_04100 [Vulcanimicrobiaceae bacterium]